MIKVNIKDHENTRFLKVVEIEDTEKETKTVIICPSKELTKKLEGVF